MTRGQKEWRAKRPTHEIDPSTLAWVAGLVEGEGSFYLTGGQYPAPRFQLNMTDRDVVWRAFDVMGVGTFNPHTPGVRSVKQQWRWRVSAMAEVAWLMDVLYPWLGLRRRSKINELRPLVPTWAQQGVRRG